MKLVFGCLNGISSFIHFQVINRVTREVGSPESEVDLFKLNSNSPIENVSRVGTTGSFSQPRSEGWKILEWYFFIFVGGPRQFSIVASKSN